MLVRLTFGSREGEVHDFLPHEASAMLADGRACLPGALASPVETSVPASPLPVEARQDRVAPGSKARRRR